MLDLIADPPNQPFSAYARHKRLAVRIAEVDRAEADRLYAETQRLIAPIRSASSSVPSPPELHKRDEHRPG